jgi:cytochrome c-type biogenesis protein CcsB
MNFINSIVIFFYLTGTATYLLFFFIQKKNLEKTGQYFLTAGFVIHTTALVYGFFSSGHIPVRNLHETLSVAGWAVVCIFLILQYKFNLKILGIYAAPLASLIMIISLMLPRTPFHDPEIFKSFWLFLHILFIFLGEASFALACGVGVLYLLQERAIKSKRPGFFFHRLPSLDLLDTIGYVCILAGFTLMTIGLITGFVYAKAIWGKFWSADPKEIWSVITWLLYAALLHGRLMIGWRGRRSAVMAIIGFAVILFTFLGVNFLLEGHHEVFTRW